MRNYWSEKGIPELQGLAPERRKAVRDHAVDRLSQTKAWITLPMVAVVLPALALGIAPDLVGRREVRYWVAGAAVLGLLVYRLGMVAEVRRHVRKILAEERDAGEATPPTEPSR